MLRYESPVNTSQIYSLNALMEAGPTHFQRGNKPKADGIVPLFFLLVFVIWLCLCCCTCCRNGKSKDRPVRRSSEPKSVSVEALNPAPQPKFVMHKILPDFVRIEDYAAVKRQLQKREEENQDLLELLKEAEAKCQSNSYGEDQTRQKKEKLYQLTKRHNALASRYKILRQLDRLSQMDEEELTIWFEQFESLLPQAFREGLAAATSRSVEVSFEKTRQQLEAANLELEELRDMCMTRREELRKERHGGADKSKNVLKGNNREEALDKPHCENCLNSESKPEILAPLLSLSRIHQITDDLSNGAYAGVGGNMNPCECKERENLVKLLTDLKSQVVEEQSKLLRSRTEAQELKKSLEIQARRHAEDNVKFDEEKTKLAEDQKILLAEKNKHTKAEQDSKRDERVLQSLKQDLLRSASTFKTLGDLQKENKDLKEKMQGHESLLASYVQSQKDLQACTGKLNQSDAAALKERAERYLAEIHEHELTITQLQNTAQQDQADHLAEIQKLQAESQKLRDYAGGKKSLRFADDEKRRENEQKVVLWQKSIQAIVLEIATKFAVREGVHVDETYEIMALLRGIRDLVDKDMAELERRPKRTGRFAPTRALDAGMEDGKARRNSGAF